MGCTSQHCSISVGDNGRNLRHINTWYQLEGHSDMDQHLVLVILGCADTCPLSLPFPLQLPM